jgi:hypothetical protein
LVEGERAAISLPMRPGDVVLSYMSSGQLDPIRIYFAALDQNKSENYLPVAYCICCTEGVCVVMKAPINPSQFFFR